MSSIETIPESLDQWPEPPRLLVEWSSPWQEFKSAIRPALRKSPKRLAGEAPVGMFPYRGMLTTWLLECLVLIAAIVIPARLASLRPYAPPPLPKWDVIYYTGDELPQTQDNGGAQAGKSGRAGGQEAHHRTQTIRVARGDRPAEKVVDAPAVNLPHTDASVANLLAYKSVAGPPPAEGLRSSLVAPTLPSAVVPPAPELNSQLSRTQASLTTNVVAPAPEISHSTTRQIPELNAGVVAPAPDMPRDRMRAAATMANPAVVAPAPNDSQRDLASSRTALPHLSDVVPPPVSAPQRDLTSTAKLSLPAQAVVAPPPSQVSRDLNSWGGSAVANIRANPVPPPPSMAGGTAANGRTGGLAQQVVPPPVNADDPSLGGSGRQNANGARGGRGTTSLGAAKVVPPPPSVGAGGGNSVGKGRGGDLTSQVVPPPPSLGGGTALNGTGRGNRGSGTGGPLDLGTAVAPPKNGGGSTPGSGIVVSNQPGSAVGVPNASGGAIAMSPTGTAKTGLGGSGGGTGIGKGVGPGSGLQGEGPGAGKEGTAHGADPNAHAGISPYPGPGGSGRGTSGSPAMPGVSVQGGNTITLPSFGAPGGGDPASGPGHSSANAHKGSGVTIVATSRSGGVFNYYGALKGDRVYSIYIETTLGTAVMQFADPASAAHPYAEDLAAPEPMHKELPAGIRPTRVVFACKLDYSGTLRDVKVLEPGAAEATSKILAALPNWKFRPAFRGNTPVEVNAILGFGVDTR